MPNIRSGKSLFDDATLRATAIELQVCFDLVSLSLSLSLTAYIIAISLFALGHRHWKFRAPS